TGEFGYPAVARNLVQESYKYGSEELDVARTIRLGIAGTKMPGSPTLTDEQLRDLSRYVLSLKGEETIETTNNQRYRRAIGATLQRK
ncbi:MAG: cytochrome c, partial [Pirellulales bacterium]|nr:cytochrome c [Pirellulales bacterium]